jgi:hypothetical protein
MFRHALVRCEVGRAVDHADRSSTAAGTIDDMTIDGRERIYMGDLGFNMAAGLQSGRAVLMGASYCLRRVRSYLDAAEVEIPARATLAHLLRDAAGRSQRPSAIRDGPARSHAARDGRV